MKKFIFSMICFCACLPMAAAAIVDDYYDVQFVNNNTQEFTALVGQMVARTGYVRFADAEIPPDPNQPVDRGASIGGSLPGVYSVALEGVDASQFRADIQWRSLVSNECTVRVIYHPRSVGPHSATLWVHCTNAGVPTVKVPLHGETTGVLGDMNGDGQLTIGDVTGMIDLLLAKNREFSQVSDINGDGQLNISDVTALINNLLAKE